MVKEIMGDDNLRADAKANRDRILDVARDALSADPQASLNSIAKAAGVGAGTLYRHFPNRESLVLSVYRKEIDALVALAPSLLAKHLPLAALRLWCDRLARFGRMKHGVADTLHAAMAGQDFQANYQKMLAALGQLMDACKSTGDLAPEADPEDFVMLMSSLWKIPPTQAGETRVKRLMATVFRGMGAKDV
ncbi:TetR/AcrR family transcriptional regulator [Hydrocarboniphaga effusa]|uniref:HTH-type transcriptional regulator n=1 Tax=Hydrocarboniphaga effusa AP103 TaxID=1172194 RepID=I7ZFC8_9GAMM|nr:TetR/AcrR family transcriptional regulator [Hydrocarboniphaga effusa]EIT70599.1 HTH-type transcriptional regulator [Hydrocarboniphaga effusa AP103]